MVQHVRPVILCGGSGTRLWPLSSIRKPKQFQPLTSSHSMLRETALRFEQSFDETVDFRSPTVIGSAKHQTFLDDDLPSATKILEPFGRNSAPAVCAACLVSGANDVVLILPADHSVKDVRSFHNSIARTVPAAQAGKIVTFGIRPTFAATGYGYIRAIDKTSALSDVEAFVEKPKQDIADQYYSDGGYYWNAGIFMFKASTMLAALEQFEPLIVGTVRDALKADTHSDVMHLDPDVFSKSPDISIDYAVMERADNIVVAPVDIGWSDVGGYQALHELFADGQRGNVTSGPIALADATSSYVRSMGPRIYAKGIKNLTVIATADEVLIAPLGDDDAAKGFGQIERTGPFSVGISPDVRSDAKKRLGDAFRTWASRAWDETSGGFVEQLDLAGHPDLSADRRVRVQARQVYSFAKAIEWKLIDEQAGRALVDAGLTYINERCRSADGGFIHILDAGGAAKDDRRDLYDHAFLILAGAAAGRITGNPLGEKIALDALRFVTTRLGDSNGQGWHEGLPEQSTRRSNPHMHLLEAMLELQQIDRTGEAVSLANNIVSLFEQKLFDLRADALVEHFGIDWSKPTDVSSIEIEPGHHYEWAVLLALHQRLTGHDTTSWQRRLIATADRIGIDEKSGFAHNAVQISGEVTNSSRRLWPQMEMLRARLVHPGISPPHAAEALYWAIIEQYFKDAPMGSWLDQTDSQGAPISKAVPASMLYHMVTSFGMLL